MRKVFTMARKEYVETVKTKTFLLGILLMPLFIVGVILYMGHTEGKIATGPRPTKKLVVTDLSGELEGELKSRLQAYNQSNSQRQIRFESLQVDEKDLSAHIERKKRQLNKHELDGYLLIPKGVVEGNSRPKLYFRMDKIADHDMANTIQSLLNEVLINRRCEKKGISPQLIAELSQQVYLEQMDVTTEATSKKPEFPVRMMTPFFFMFLMFMGMFGTNQQMLTSIIEEKNSRVIEVLLSAVSPLKFMAGKILGLSAVGLTVVSIWGLAAYGAATYKGVTGIFNAGNLGYFLLYFILGFILFSSIFAAIGSACNTIKEAQSLVMPISLLFIVPMVGWMHFAQYPDGALATGLSFVPPLTPLLMMIRLAAWPELPLLQVIGSIVLLVVSVPLVMWASAKVFRTGILMYGKSPTPRELLRWLRYK